SRAPTAHGTIMRRRAHTTLNNGGARRRATCRSKWERMDTSEAPAEPCTYAVGDLHGEVRLLRRMLALLPVRPEDTLLFMGDYLDRGEDSAATIAALRELEAQRPVIFLRGNHEDAWLDEAIWDGARFRRPAEIGGARKAWRDFGGAPPPDLRPWLAATLIDYE